MDLQALNRVNAAMVEALGESGRTVLPGRGAAAKGLMVIAPSPDSDALRGGAVFAGAEGEYFEKILRAVNLSFDDCYVTYLVPYESRKSPQEPEVDEVLNCAGWLDAQLAVVNPKMILTMGDCVTRWFLNHSVAFERMLGRWYQWQSMVLRPLHLIKTLLDNPKNSTDGPKYRTWLDMQEVSAKLEESV